VSTRFLPVTEPDLAGNEKKYVNEALDEGWISSNGRFIDRFEREFAEYCGTEHAVACCNGTVALHVLLLALGIGPGDEVLVPSFTYVASANSVAYTGATPILVESEAQHWNLDPKRLEEAITPRTRAIMVVHLYGHPTDMAAVEEVARRHDLLVVEDAAEAHGARVAGRTVGSFGVGATFSFYGNKIITTGEGGMITTHNRELAAKVRLLRGQGMDPQRRYWFPIVGYNYRMTNLAAALGCAQMERVETFIARRRELASWYHDSLAPAAESLGMQLAGEAPGTRNVHWLASLRVPAQKRDGLMRHLLAQGIDSRPFFPPLHTLPIYSDVRYHGNRDLGVAEELGATGLNLPTFGAMTRADVDRVANAIVQYLSLEA